MKAPICSRILLALFCLLVLATSASPEEPSQDRAEAIRERARAAAIRAQEAVRATQWTLNVRWLLWSKETVMFAETSHLRVLWTLLQAENKEEACQEARSARLADAKTLGYTVNDRGFVFPYPTRMVRYLCFPDTVDPRGAKGK
jgi:hypothetical protein